MAYQGLMLQANLKPTLESHAIGTERFYKRRKEGGTWAEGSGRLRLTFALQALPQEAPEQRPTVVTERGDLVVVDPELVGHVDTEPLGAHLQDGKTEHQHPGRHNISTQLL